MQLKSGCISCKATEAGDAIQRLQEELEYDIKTGNQRASGSIPEKEQQLERVSE